MELHLLPPDAPPAAAERWDRFVAHCPEATFFHRAGWRDVLVRSFGHVPHFMYAEEGGEIVGVLPLARMKSMIFGDALVSTPFCVYGGVAASTDAARLALEEAAVKLGVELGVDHVEFRNLRPRRSD
ncbi:MAG: peptidoglycan bridge formation protein FemAB, partial [Candidatus Eisenbacteria bacterium]|nr:peptidoglycan bridge formation protein FemAB [Candidatus Eisenbacteria bacterium]